MWANSPKILLANALLWCQGLYEGMQYMFGLESSLTQALLWLTILAGSYLPLERFIDRFCHKFANFNGLKGDSCDSILVIVDWLTKMVHYKLVKIIIDAPGLAKVIIDVVVRHHNLLDLIIINRGSLFTSKFWSLLYYFLGITQKLSTAFHPQIDRQTKKQNSIMEAYLRAFVNFKQNDWA